MDKAQIESNIKFSCLTISSHILSLVKTEMNQLCFMCVRVSEKGQHFGQI